MVAPAGLNTHKFSLKSILFLFYFFVCLQDEDKDVGDDDGEERVTRGEEEELKKNKKNMLDARCFALILLSYQPPSTLIQGRQVDR